MAVEGISGLAGTSGLTSVKQATPAQAQSSFTESLKSAIESLNETQQESDKMTQDLAAGKVDNLHDVMIASQKASVALDAAVQVQKKAIDAYTEMMRMSM
ncbi:flagellar hook-basal body complex protein FliE [Terribacillus saccharophilus]|uniref:Flagellar hook-basal body complex protein FliE n=1 Tax=Terribacillus saccharophilus TaxID=361277 RepID=A0A268AAF2_9BACI|nr:flagellar hook-basal body complex protein FliE [Terribacillus saccharophilus]PAD21097.1 flagellar hook-basal body complex protein FliE [Terribacillus saccharophilus]PAF17410.1 flagellar hook-basal body complex protein FliE [Terribacillus saccharophilus]PAF22178.1 flagellar hook-basal body complex protein FliE [Terribacillus saccharophilus]PAF38371.1 flagellar hook-basal body complex protein FliE [Terribacillus saccharophilus]PAF40128.1 flagellar hook-basal body complex protein FliE [Terriba